MISVYAVVKSRAFIAIALVAAIAGALAWLSFESSTAPSGQPPLVHVDDTSFAALRSAFNAAAAETRMIVLLSPT